MLNKFCLFAAALCVSSYAMAASPSIGTVTARGYTSIDNFRVEGSGTVFDGSVVETGNSALSSADLRLAKDGAVVTLNVNSRGTIYRDHLLLQRGSVQLGSANAFRVLANGLVVEPSGSDSRGVVGIDDANAVMVEAQKGTIEIKNAAGATVAAVHPGHPLSFSSVSGKSSSEFSAEGTVSSENGHYYFTASETGEKYELKGSNLKSHDGASVVASGILEGAAPAAGIAGILLSSSLQSSNSIPMLGQSAQTNSLIGGISVGKPRAMNVVQGGDGGYCDSKSEIPCCQNTQGGSQWAGVKCCPGFVPTKSQCTGSH
jgi:hypothetical protein